MQETQRRRRRHSFVPGLDVQVPRLYATEGTKMDDKTIVVHYFCAAGDWFIAEADFDSGEAFGYARLAAYPDGGSGATSTWSSWRR